MNTYKMNGPSLNSLIKEEQTSTKNQSEFDTFQDSFYKYGEIFLECVLNKFIIYCSFCDEPYYSLRKLTKHIYDNHLQAQKEDFMDLNFEQEAMEVYFGFEMDREVICI